VRRSVICMECSSLSFSLSLSLSIGSCRERMEGERGRGAGGEVRDTLFPESPPLAKAAPALPLPRSHCTRHRNRNGTRGVTGTCTRRVSHPCARAFRAQGASVLIVQRHSPRHFIRTRRCSAMFGRDFGLRFRHGTRSRARYESEDLSGVGRSD